MFLEIQGLVNNAMDYMQWREAYFVETTTNIDGWLLNDVVDNLGKGSEEVWRVDFWVEEDLRGKEAFVANVNFVFLSLIVSMTQRGGDERL